MDFGNACVGFGGIINTGHNQGGGSAASIQDQSHKELIGLDIHPCKTGDG